MRGGLVVCLLWLGACRGGGDPVEEGDRLYRDGAFAEAVMSYRSAAGASAPAGLWARLGAAALEARDVATALEAYEALGLSDPTRRAEAARGVERAARLVTGTADSAGHGKRALEVLQRIVPGRPIGRVVWATGALAPSSPAGDLLPSAVSVAAPGPGVTGLLLDVATARAAAGQCEAAMGAYRTVLRRLTDSAAHAAALLASADCAMWLGEQALAQDQAEVAERWFDEASRGAGAPARAAAAQLGWGDARLRQGDVLAAAIVWQGIATRTDIPDSLANAARDRLRALAGEPAGPGQRDTVQ